MRFHFHSDCQATSTVDSSIRMNSQLNRAYVFPEVARGELDVNRFMQVTERNWVAIDVYSGISSIAHEVHKALQRN